MAFLRTIVAIYAAASVAALQPTSTPSSAPQLPPSTDPWYRAPAGFEREAPGAVLKVRPAPGNLTAVYGNSSASYNVLYRTTDSHYRPDWAVTTLFVPRTNSSTSERGNGLVSYQIPYNSPWIDSSPSYTLAGSEYANSIVGSDIQTLLSYGFFVNVPDHEGPLAAFTCAVSEGYATLDSIRAVRSLHTTDKSAVTSGTSNISSARVALWGYSGGGLASEFAAELQVQYAPELDIAGAAIGGVVANASETLLKSNGGYFAGLVPSALLGLAKQYPGVNRTLRGALHPTGPYNSTAFLGAEDQDIATIFTEFAYQDTSGYFVNDSLSALLRSPAISHAVDSGLLMGYHGLPAMPLLVYQAVHDELCPVALVDALVARYCAAGARIDYRRNSIGGHLAQESNGDAGALAWLRGLLSGRLVPAAGCSTTNVAINVTDSPL